MKRFFAWLEQWFPGSSVSLAGAFGLATLVAASFPALLEGGHIVFGDIDIGFFLESYEHRVNGVWNSLWSNPNFFNLSRWPVMSILLSLASEFGVGASVFLKLFIGLLLWTGAWGMFLLASYWVRKTSHLPDWWIWGIGMLAGVLYGLGPWALVRVQHIFLLVGYCLLPFICRFAPTLTRAYPGGHVFPSRVKKALFVVGVLWAVSVGAVHYLFFTGLWLAGWWAFRLIESTRKGHHHTSRVLIWRGVVLVLGVVGLLAYTLVPQLGAAAVAPTVPNNVNTLDSIVLFSRESAWWKALMGVSYWWTMFSVSDLPWTLWVGGGGIVLLALFGAGVHIRKGPVRFWVYWTVVTYVVSLGTQGPLRSLLLWLIFEAPGSGVYGFLFRDPNKITGLYWIGLVLLMAIGLGTVMSELHRLLRRRRKEAALVKQLYPEATMKAGWWRYMMWVTMAGASVGVLFYVEPFQQVFMGQFYRGVEVPWGYDAIEALPQRGGRTLFFPRAEMETSPEEEFATTAWNDGKATSAIDIFSTNKYTYNTTEGTTPHVSHVMRFITMSMERGLSWNMGTWLQALGVEEVLYHHDIRGFGERNRAFVANLMRQREGEEYLQQGFFHRVGLPEPVGYMHLFPRVVYGMNGLSSLHTLAEAGVDFSTLGVWLGETGESFVPYVRAGDVWASRFWVDSVGDLIEDEYRLKPYDAVKYADGFSRWARTRTTTGDWRWHLDHLGIKYDRWEVDNTEGVVYTYASKGLDKEPYEDVAELGNLWVSTADFANAGQEFFDSHDPDRLTVEFSPTSTYANMPFVHGEVSRGQEAYWKVASSPFVDIEPENAYAFALTMSGRATNQIHGKVKYFDAQGEEMTVSYVSAPRRVKTFDFVRFTGQFLTPPGAAKMQLQLWTHQQPEETVYWWVHDVEIRDLKERVVPNIVKMRRPITKSGPYRVMARVFHNRAGGKVEVRVGDQAYTVTTKSPQVNQWRWEDLGEIPIPAGILDVEIENLEGFNAVQTVAVVPVESWEEYERILRERTEDVTRVVFLEAEQDTPWSGHVQWDGTDAMLSGGKGVRLDEGVVSATFDVVNEGPHTVWVRTEVFAGADRESGLWVYPEIASGRTLQEKRVLRDAELWDKEYVNVGTWDFFPGRVQLKVVVKDEKPSLMPTESLHPFQYAQEWTERERYADTLSAHDVSDECCDCVDLGDGYLNVVHEGGEDVSTSTITAGCSCWWAITASNIAPVEENQPYVFLFDARSAFARRPHFKVIFLDENLVYLDHHTLRDTPEDDTWDWERIERVVTMPERTKYAQLQTWSRQNRFTESQTQVRGLTVKAWHDLPLVDTVAVAEGEYEAIEDLWAHEKNEEDLRVVATWGGEFAWDVRVEGEGSGVLQLAESYTKLWQMRDSETGEVVPTLPGMMMLNHFRVEGGKEYRIELVAHGFFRTGLGVSAGVVLAWLVWALVHIGGSDGPTLRSERKKRRRKRREERSFFEPAPEEEMGELGKEAGEKTDSGT